MKLTGELEEKVNETADKAEAKKIIEQAGMILTDDELEKVAGGEQDSLDHGNTVDASEGGTQDGINIHANPYDLPSRKD